MSEFKPVETKAELDALCGDEVLAGYLHGLDCADEPGSDRSKAYWHGWRNAQADRGRMPVDIHQRRLVIEYLGARVKAH